MPAKAAVITLESLAPSPRHHDQLPRRSRDRTGCIRLEHGALGDGRPATERWREVRRGVADSRGSRSQASVARDRQCRVADTKRLGTLERLEGGSARRRGRAGRGLGGAAARRLASRQPVVGGRLRPHRERATRGRVRAFVRSLVWSPDVKIPLRVTAAVGAPAIVPRLSMGRRRDDQARAAELCAAR